MPARLGETPKIRGDDVFALTAAFQADTDPRKVNLGAGVYKDENSNPWVLPSVKAAKEIISRSNLDHEYLPIHGSTPFLKLARNLVLGNIDSSKRNITSVQTISGTGANHLGAALLSQQLRPRQVFISDPTWGNHHLIWEVAGPNVVRKTYPYYDFSTHMLDFQGMRSTLEAQAEEDDVVILHACAHNPTGADPTHEQWSELAQLFKRKKLFAFFDSAYQGFATGDVDADAWAIRHFYKVLFEKSSENTSAGPQGMCIAQSFAKNFGLYGERVGALHLIFQPEIQSAGLYSQLRRLIRAEFSNPPLFGARIVYTILSDPQLRARWEQDLQAMCGRIKRVRQLLRQEIEKQRLGENWRHIETQIGMFSYTGLSRDQVLRLQDVHHVYIMPNGRVSMSGVNEGNVKYIAQAIAEVLAHEEGGR